MIGQIIKIIVLATLVAAIIFTMSNPSSSAVFATQFGHIKDALNFIGSYIKQINDTFPALAQLIYAFAAVLIVEILVLLTKVSFKIIHKIK